MTLGRISYGVYLYHRFLAAALDSVMSSLGTAPIERGPMRFAILYGSSILVAALSWLLLERPALSLRRHFRRTADSALIVPATPSAA